MQVSHCKSEATVWELSDHEKRSREFDLNLNFWTNDYATGVLLEKRNGPEWSIFVAVKIFLFNSQKYSLSQNSLTNLRNSRKRFIVKQ